MGRIRGKDTKPELEVRKILHSLGYRFTINGPKNRDLPGKPDIVLPKHHAVILVHGCFWHRHPDCRFAYTPRSRVEFWTKKFERNVARDQEVKVQLEEFGWKVTIVWECELRSAKGVEELKNRLRSLLDTQ